jgi:uncharacterized membrane protein
MDLDLLPLGWVHFIACLAALVVGALVLLRPKGTAVHRRRGRIYAGLIVLASITALGIYRTGVFFFPHWFGVAALIAVALGVTAAHFQWPRTGWVHLHLTCMVASYYILVGGGVNEVFLRIDVLHRLVPNFGSPVIGWTHFAVMLFFMALIAYFNAVVLLRWRGAPAIPSGSASTAGH